MSPSYVLDTGVLFSTWTSKIPTGTFFTTSAALAEIRNKPSKVRTELLTVLDRLREDLPTQESLKAVKKAAATTGDSHVLSDVDIEIIALAHSKKISGEKIILVSMDLALLNTARHLEISVFDPSGRFKDQIIWSLKCPACNHRSKTTVKNLECPICGTMMRRIVQRKRKAR